MSRLPIVCIVGVVASILLIVCRDFPLAGHDYRYFIPRLLDTDLHLRINGLGVQWYTPTFGGGLPAFPNPQHVQYSLLQALSYFFNPWSAVLILAAATSSVGYYALCRFLSATLSLGSLASALGALFWIGNGFYIERMIVGHVGLQAFPLCAVFLDALTDRRRPIVVNGSVVALTTAAMLYQAGFFVIVLCFLSLGLTLFVIGLWRRDAIDIGRIARVTAVAVPLTLAMAGPKVYAVFSLMAHVPRDVTDVFDISTAQALTGFVAQFLGAMTTAPFLLLAGIDLTHISTALLKLTGASVRSGIWEVDTGLSPVLLVFLAAGILSVLRHVGRHGLPATDQRTRLIALALAIAVWMVLEATLARGLIYPQLRRLPVISALHVNHRFAASLILPLVIIGAALIDRWSRRASRRLQLIVVAAALLAPLSYLFIPPRVHLRTFDLTQSLSDARRIRDGERFPVVRIEAVEDAEALSKHASSLVPYDPLFGYAGETFRARTRVGDVRESRDGFFNLTHPASLVFPELNGLQPFDLIAASDAEALEAFMTRRQPDWPLPAIVPRLNLLALLGLVVTVGVLVSSLTRGVRKQRHAA